MRLGDLLRAKTRGESPEDDRSGSGWRSEVQSVLIEDIVQSPFQPRQTFAEEELQQLAASISEHGVLHPIIVRPREIGYELVVGERRLRASMILGWQRIPAIVKEMDDAQAAEVALIENIQREALDMFEEAQGMRRLIDEFGFTQEQMAERLGKSQSSVANKLRLLRLGAEVQAVISREMLSERHARALLSLDDEEDRLSVLNQVVRQGLNVRQTESLIAKVSQKEEDQKKQDTQTIKGIYKDYRLLRNSVKQLVDQMKTAGAPVALTEVKDEDFVEIRVRFDMADKDAAGRELTEEGGP